MALAVLGNVFVVKIKTCSLCEGCGDTRLLSLIPVACIETGVGTAKSEWEGKETLTQEAKHLACLAWEGEG